MSDTPEGEDQVKGKKGPVRIDDSEESIGTVEVEEETEEAGA